MAGKAVECPPREGALAFGGQELLTGFALTGGVDFAARQDRKLAVTTTNGRFGAGGRLSAIGCFKREADISPMNVEGSI